MKISTSTTRELKRRLKYLQNTGRVTSEISHIKGQLHKRKAAHALAAGREK